MCDGGGRPTAGEELDEVLAVVKRLRGRARPGRTPSGLADELLRLRHARDLLELEFATVAGEFAATDEYDRQGSVSPVDWIRHQCQMSRSAAEAAVRVGEQAAQMPASVEAIGAGQIGFAHLALLARTAAQVREATGEFDEAPLLERARLHSVGRFRHDCAHARHAADARGVLREHVAAVEARTLELKPCGDGGVAVQGWLDAVGGATLRSALEPLAARTGAADERLRDHRLADALVELASQCLDAGKLPTRSGQRPHLHVTASLETLRGLPGAPAGEVEWGPPIPAATVQRLACDAGIARVLLGPESAVIDVGRALRVPAPATRRALLARDHGCVWPRCDRSAAWSVAHHLRHWAHGGPTDMNNLVLLCHRHHWMVHEGGWQLVRSDDRGMLAVAPPGHVPRAREPDVTAAA